VTNRVSSKANSVSKDTTLPDNELATVKRGGKQVLIGTLYGCTSN
jgi:hypothetical protein